MRKDGLYLLATAVRDQPHPCRVPFSTTVPKTFRVNSRSCGSVNSDIFAIPFCVAAMSELYLDGEVGITFRNSFEMVSLVRRGEAPDGRAPASSLVGILEHQNLKYTTTEL